MDGESKYSIEDLKKFISDGTDIKIFVAVCDNAVCGHVFCILKDSKTFYIDDLCVDPSYRRRGVAKRLMERAEAYGRSNGCVFMTLNVWNGNNSAKEFYVAYGMTERSTTLEKRL